MATQVRATHKGECQVCGRTQKLPREILAKHGYTVDWGFFNGTCWGAGYLPLERDNSLLAKAIEWAEAQHTAISEKITTLLADEQPTKVWATYYERRGRGYVSMWMDTADIVEAEARSTWSGHWGIPIVSGSRTPEFASLGYKQSGGRSRTAIQAAYEANSKHVERELVPERSRIKSYIAWQERRNRDWELKLLQEVE